jgi:hypothetical protein
MGSVLSFGVSIIGANAFGLRRCALADEVAIKQDVRLARIARFESGSHCRAGRSRAGRSRAHGRRDLRCRIAKQIRQIYLDLGARLGSRAWCAPAMVSSD